MFGSKDKRGLSVSLDDIIVAQAKIRTLIPISPLTHSPNFSDLVGHEVYFKWDNKLKTGSFKERGAANVLLSLDQAARSSGVCAASLGNHALALSYHSAKLGVPCVIIMPSSAPLVKVQSTRATGAEVILHGNTFDEAYQYAQTLALERGLFFVPAFDHPLVIAGQGTAGLEMLEQLDSFDSVVIPVGGGGLASGIATAIKARRPDVHVVGVRSQWVMHARQHANATPQPLLPPTTIADGIAVKVPGKVTAPLLEKVLDQTIVVSESEIADAVIRMLELERVVVEGAAAAGVAALLKKCLPPHCKRTVLEISGSNIDMNVLSRLIERDMGEKQRLLRLDVAVPDRPGSLHTITGIIARTGANVLQVSHDRSFSHIPGNVDITFMLEVRDQLHKDAIIKNLADLGIDTRVV
ncbi:MAG: threonine ammonia-lyase [Oligoflexia bacterium]|nr:threonine ammonia-lyase [Oligoflexia bacterium]